MARVPLKHIINENAKKTSSTAVVVQGKSAYELAVQKGFNGTLEEWILSLKGDDGSTPVKGVDYFDGNPGAPGYTPIKGVDYSDGDKGDKGDKGDPGDDADVTTHESTYVHANIATAYDHSQSSHLQFSGLVKITVGGTQPSNPTTGDLWINTNT